MKFLALVVAFALMSAFSFGQTRTNHNSQQLLSSTGKFNKQFQTSEYNLDPPDTSNIIRLEQADRLSKTVRPFRFAHAMKVNLDVASNIKWISEMEYSYGKFDIKVKGAKSLSVNFDNFYLPDETEIFIYNANGRMITGPITGSENSSTAVWGSSVYKGDKLTIEIKIPSSAIGKLKLNINNVAYGYKNIFSSYDFGGFGDSSGCEINVLCPLGAGWGNERNSVMLILDQNGVTWCSGAMINNACNLNLPYLLTANHCLDNGTEDVTRWRFIFQYWSAQCAPSADNLNTLLFNGSVLKATSVPSDFLLLELNQTPANNSNITYAGWNRDPNPALNTLGIHHPEGDVMKISSDANPPITVSWMGGALNHWRAHFQQGTVEPGSSGSPLFDQNHRIVGQLHGDQNNQGNFCTQQIGEYGKFDVSWVGEGTNTTRLSNWLDPNNTGVLALNTNGIPYISGPSSICSTGTYTFNNLQPGATVTWSTSNSSFLSINAATGYATRVSNYNGGAIVYATINGACTPFATSLIVGAPVVNTISIDGNIQPYPLCSSGTNITYTANQDHILEIGVGNGGSNPTFTLNDPSHLVSGSVLSPGRYDFISKSTSPNFSISYSTSNSCGTTTQCLYFSNSGPCIFPAFNSVTINGSSAPPDCTTSITFNANQNYTISASTAGNLPVTFTLTDNSPNHNEVTGTVLSSTSYRVRANATTYSFLVNLAMSDICGSAYRCLFFCDGGNCQPAAPIRANSITSNMISVFPNPASSLVTVQVSDSTLIDGQQTNLDQPFSIIIVDRYSQKVASVQSTEKTIQIPTDGFPPDIYYLILIYKDAVIQKQIVIKR